MNINNIHEEKNIKEININNIHGRRPSPPHVGFVLRFVVRGAVAHRGRHVLLWRCAVLHDGQRAPVIVGDPANPHSVRPWDGDVPLPPASSPPLPRSTASPPTGSGGGEGASAAAAITGGRRSLPSHRTWRRGGRSRHRRLHSRRIRRRGGHATACRGSRLPPNLVEGRVRAPPLSSPEAAAASHPVRPGEGDGAVTATRPPPHAAERSERGERKREKDKADARSARRLGSVLDRCRLF